MRACRRKNKKLLKIIFTGIPLWLTSCAGNPSFFTTPSPTVAITTNSAATPAQQLTESQIHGARIEFNYSSFYTVTSPNSQSSCPGDILSFNDYWAANPGTTSNPFGTPQKLQLIQVNSPQTLQPSFIKNISVDVTDSNSTSVLNRSKSCSYGVSSGFPSASSCATFDYSSASGIDSPMAGRLLIIGGVQSSNLSAINSTYSQGFTLNCGAANTSTANASSSLVSTTCNSLLFSIGVNTYPASLAGSALAPGVAPSPVPTSPISNWLNYSSYLTALNTTGSTASNPIMTGTPPQGMAAAASTISQSLQKILFFGGSSSLNATTPVITEPTTYDTWTFNIASGQWSSIPTSINLSPSITYSNDNIAAVAPASSTLLQISRVSQGRGLFGYSAISGMGISYFGSSGSVGASNPAVPANDNSPVDTTDRIVITGGLCNGSIGICTDSLKFNPTYAPEYQDALTPSSGIAVSTATIKPPDQWIDSYHTQTMTNADKNNSSAYGVNPGYPSNLSPYFPAPASTPSPVVPYTDNSFGTYGFGMTGIMNNRALGTTGMWSSNSASIASATGPNTPGTGYILTAGGFLGLYGGVSQYNTPSTSATGCSSTDNLHCGGLSLNLKWYTPAVGGLSNNMGESNSANFTSVTNLTDSIGTEVTPGRWVSIKDGTLPVTTPWFGGGILLKGIGITSACSSSPCSDSFNEVVYFGGSPCYDYILSSSSCTNQSTNPGRYWSFTQNPSFQYQGNASSSGFATNAVPAPIASANPGPINAGMAAARGLDPGGRPLIVAWGGVVSWGGMPSPVPGSVDSSGAIYYLYNNSGTPTWSSDTAPSGTAPAPMVNSALVFSHVTGKFYLFGGYNPAQGLTSSTNVTYELSFTPSTTTTCATSGGCHFTWKQLSPTCYPNCSNLTTRRGHRMLEANYNYFNAPYEPVCTNSSTPCSFGIFMEGGSHDGTNNFLADRWMFDPTGNGGVGHWQMMTELPPRSFASMTNVDYTVSSAGSNSGGTAHLAVLFGGETGSQNPASYKTGNYFVPPTLGDTWMFDFNSSHWNRVKLLGGRYGSTQSLATADERTARAASTTADTSTQIMTPPPLSGAIMVTRTYSRPNHLSTDTPTTLDLPEIFLLGGRTKDGMLHPLNRVYKFCAGSTGEKPYSSAVGPTSFNGSAISAPDDASCDAYDATTNPNSPNPTGNYEGRWLFKNPFGAVDSTGTLNSGQVSSFLGAGVYDPNHDLILVYGGWSAPSTATYASTVSVTSATRTLNNSDGAIFEYTPPSKLENGPASVPFNGSWNYIPSCQISPAIPTARYGHSITYNPTTQNLIMTGGFSANGTPLVQSVTTYAGATYFTPETWTATRIDQSIPSGILKLGIPADTSDSFPCYYWSQVNTFGNTPDAAFNQPINSASGTSANAAATAGIAHASTFYIPASGYNTGYYSLNGAACAGDGIISGSDQYVGGAYFDIDRTKLGPTENLILNITFLPLGPTNTDPSQAQILPAQAAHLRVNLIKTGENLQQLQTHTQPRDLIYSDTVSYPVKAYEIAILAPPTGQIRQEQIYIPLSIDPTIDRIRLERVSGSAILIDASLSRLSF